MNLVFYEKNRHAAGAPDYKFMSVKKLFLGTNNSLKNDYC